MQEISKNTAPSSLLHLGVSVARDDSAPLIVTLIGHCGTAAKVEAAAPTPIAEPVRATTPALFQEEAIQSTPPPSTHAEAKTASPKVKQEDLPLEPIARGRFEKVEPTIVEGEDLDVPTFLRRKLKK